MPRGLYIYQYTRMTPFVKGTAHFIRPAAAFFFSAAALFC